MTSGAKTLIALGNSALALNTVNGDQLFIVRLDGDYDANGIVSAADYEVWKANYGSTENLAADGNRDGIVDTADFVIWRHNLGQTLVGTAEVGSGASLPVPEPATLVVALAILAVYLSPLRRTIRSTVLWRMQCGRPGRADPLPRCSLRRGAISNCQKVIRRGS
jgi:hypothetical protein